MKAINNTSIYLLVIMLGCGQLFGQQTIKPLKIGDTLAPIQVSNIINRPAKTVDIAKLAQDGLLIIDFWATWCIPCLQEMKFLDSLKAAHPGRFNVLMVTTQDSLTVKKFLTENKDIGTTNLYMATNNQQLKQFFPHRYIPHNVWIDHRLAVKAITSSEEITQQNILDFNRTNSQKLETKKDNMTFNYFDEFHLGDSIFTYRSIITPGIKGLGGLIRGNHPLGELSKQHLYINGTITQHLWSAYMGGSVRYQLIEVHTKDSLRFFHPTDNRAYLLVNSKYKNLGQWRLENIYCYALTLPRYIPIAKKRDYIFNDFERQFNIKISIQPRRTRIVKVSGHGKFIKSSLTTHKSGDPLVRWMPGYKLSIRNATLEQVFNWYFKTSQAKNVAYPFKITKGKAAYLNLDVDFTPYLNKEQKSVNAKIFYQAFTDMGYHIKEKTAKYPKLIIEDLN
ncbi:TlpA disulfide reductase family protein [Pedobacter sp. UBA4863]|uniref:TlpA family protein disulfide reductase n=1 Tax=Pedobacter sp. UBA4863 TaxID=1947060 RepID=UPI0025ECE7DD|nr:TlpA disulfide reductase family protein [Pedobacter sp. UBA4863]